MKATNVTLLALLATTTLAPSLWAAEGGVNGGGGNAVVCRNSQGAIARAELLDLYEGEVRYDYEVARDSDSVAAMSRALNRSPDPLTRNLIEQSVAHVLNNYEFLRSGVALNPSADLGKGIAIPVPEGCRLEGVGYYEDDGKLKVSRSVYQALSPTDRAAFFLHEAAYRLAREMKQQDDSKDSRRYVAAAFSPEVSNDFIKQQLGKILTVADYGDADSCLAKKHILVDSNENPEWRVKVISPKLGERNHGNASLKITCSVRESLGGGTRILGDASSDGDLYVDSLVKVGDCDKVGVRFNSGVWRYQRKEVEPYEYNVSVKQGSKTLTRSAHKTGAGPSCDFTGYDVNFVLSRPHYITSIPDGTEVSKLKKRVSGEAGAVPSNNTSAE
ncbi:MAG: hypothetical protein AB7K68_10940 [Bacteriovoracia bacterium]